MKKFLLVFSVFFIFACNNEEVELNQNSTPSTYENGSQEFGVKSNSQYQLRVKDVTPTSFTVYYGFMSDYPWHFMYMDGKQILGDRNVREKKLTNLTPGKTYTVSGLVRHVVGGNRDVSAIPVTVTLPTANQPVRLAKPSFSSLISSEDTISLTINKVTNANIYRYKLYEKSGGTRTLVKNQPFTGLSRNYTGLKSDTTYEINIVAYAKGFQESPALNQEIKTKAKQAATPPPANTSDPYQLKVKDVTPTSFTVYYDFMSDYPWHFMYMEGKQILGDRNVREKKLTNLTPGKTYTVSGLVRHVVGGNRDVSAIPVTVTLPTTNQPVRLAKPNFSSLVSSEDTISLTINKVTNANIYRYKLYEKSGGTRTLVKNEPFTGLSRNYTGLKSDTTYEINIVAYAKGFQESPALNQEVKTKAKQATTPPPTNVVDGDPIENFGAIAFYSEDKFFGTININYISPTRSRIDYTGSDSPFNSSYVGKEFVALRAHMNPLANPTTTNYFPEHISSRYSKVTKVLSGKSLEVNFGYNGGNRNQPQNSMGAYGYFFHDNRQAFVNAFSTTNRKTKILLKSGKTYVTKGAWGVDPKKTLVVNPSGNGNSAIKISMEDYFATKNVDNPANATFKNDFGSGTFFLTQDNNNSVIFKNIDILPNYMLVSKPGMGAGQFFKTVFNPSSQCENVREYTIQNSNSFRELELIASKYPNFPAGLVGLLPNFADSLCGGKDDGFDITHFQSFKLLNSDWKAAFPITVKNNYHRAGNIFVVKGDDPVERSKLYGSNEGFLKSKPLRIRVEKDSRGDYRIAKILSSGVTGFEFEHDYWIGGSSNGAYHQFKTPVGRVNFMGARDMKNLTGSEEWPQKILLDAKTILLAEKIPSLNQTYQAIRKNSSNVLLIDEIMLFNGDILEIAGKRYTIVNVQKKYEGGRYGNYSEVTLNGNSESTLDFKVVSSNAYQLTTAGGVAAEFEYTEAAPGYLTYSNHSTNFIFENVDLKGRLRASARMQSAEDNSKLYKQASIMTFKNAHFEAPMMDTLGGPANQFAESDDLYIRSQITGQKSYAIIDNSTVFWNRLNNNQSEIYLKNHPTLISGNTSVGGPRFYGGLYQDGQGFTVDSGGYWFEFMALDGKNWNLSNMKLVTDRAGAVSGMMTVGGHGTVDLSHLKRKNPNASLLPTLVLANMRGRTVNEPSNLYLVADQGEGAVATLGFLEFLKSWDNTFIDFANWKLGPGMNCTTSSGNCLPNKNSNTYSNNIKINN